MDNRNFISKLAKKTNLDSKRTAQLSLELAQVIAEYCSQNESVALPGFGTFVSLKQDEHIETDKENGTKTLMPPSITVYFKPGTRLKKAVSKS